MKTSSSKLVIARLEKSSSSQPFIKEEQAQEMNDRKSNPSHPDDTGKWRPKFHKLEFPAFYGSEDALTWLTCVEQFHLQGTLKSSKGVAHIISFVLAGITLVPTSEA